jgi:hypothetical protein
MKKLIKTTTLFSLLVAGIFALTSFATDSLPKTFTDLLTRTNMVFESPDSVASTPLIYTHAISYEYAIKYPHKNFEVRYDVKPSDNAWKEYELHKKEIKKGDINTNPDSTCLSAFQTIILNVSGTLPNVTEFDKTSVKQEFNADWGGTVAVVPRKEFAQNYKYCMIVALHKSHKGDAYIFFLSDSPDGFNESVATVFHALKFKAF